MGVFKDEKRNTWYVQCWYKNWKGESHKKMKRGFATKHEASEWERSFLATCKESPTMSFEDFYKLYEQDRRPHLRQSTWEGKSYIVNEKILPYFGKKPITEITPSDILKWEAELMNYTDGFGGHYSDTYLRTVSNQLCAILNHAVRYYNLPANPMSKAGKMGSAKSREMRYWTKDEYLKFADEMMDKPLSFAAFEILYWTGIREGELLALTPADFDFKKRLLSINKSYQRIRGEDVITPPKTPKSTRVIAIPAFLSDETKDYLSMRSDLDKHDRIFKVSKSYLHHEMDRGSKAAGVKRIRIHDLRHSHISLLIEMGFSALAIADRMGHESVDITFRYAHLFPNKQSEMAQALDLERGAE